MTDFGRVLTAMVTPLTAEGEVDYRRAQELPRRCWRAARTGWCSPARPRVANVDL